MITFEKLMNIMNEHNIPSDVTILTDPHWECGATHVNVVYFNREKNVLSMRQDLCCKDYDLRHFPEDKRFDLDEYSKGSMGGDYDWELVFDESDRKNFKNPNIDSYFYAENEELNG